jgi:hypothetical protein
MKRANFDAIAKPLRRPAITSIDSTKANFDHIARLYRWLEYLTLGPTLQRCRTHFIPALLQQHHALLFGDGDGRFLADLLHTNATLQAEAVDSSAAMLELLSRNCEASAPRLQTHQADARAFTPSGRYDLIVTNFFLDCLSQQELDAFVLRIASSLSPKGLWLVSDFRIPGGALRLPAQIFVRSLYFAFRILTSLRTTRLPNHHAPLNAAGLMLNTRHTSLCGILITELWQLNTDNVHQSSMALPSANPDQHDPPLDPIPDPEPISPSLEEPDPGVYRHDPTPPIN